MDLKELTYEQLEEKADGIVKQLESNTLGLDQATKLYKEGKEYIQEMENRLNSLLNEVKDDVENE